MNVTDLNLSDRCEHFSCPERSLSPALYILLYVCSAAVVLLTVCGNLIIIISVLHFKQLHTPTNMLVFSLAVSDFFIGALVMFPMLIWIIESCWIFERIFCICYFLFSGFFMNFSIYNITLIAVDRYFALSHPFLYTKSISTSTMIIVVSFNCCVSLIYNTAFLYFNGQFIFVLCPGECISFMNEVCFIIDLIVTFIFPLCVIIILYSGVFMIAKKHATAIRDLNNHTRPQTQKITSHSMKSERKAAKVLGILVSVFLICLLPYYIYTLLGDVVEIQEETVHKVMIVFFLNSTINPVIYALFYPWFRKCFKIIINLKIFHTDSALFNVYS